jgi:hypothetical protein
MKQKRIIKTHTLASMISSQYHTVWQWKKQILFHMCMRVSEYKEEDFNERKGSWIDK